MPFEAYQFNIMFAIVSVFMTILFLLVIGMFIFAMVKGISRWRYNNSQPILTVLAEVVSKREAISSSMHHNGDNFAQQCQRVCTTYYITFEVESGSRLEFEIEGKQYGLIIEGDKGKLTFQGTRYLGFGRG
jgi:hypothetical protein